jgi:hypothetical protein
MSTQLDVQIDSTNLGAFIASNFPPPIKVSFDQYVKCFTGKLDIDKSNPDFFKLTHPDYPIQYVKIYINRSYNENNINYSNISLSADGNSVIYKALWFLHICQDPGENGKHFSLEYNEVEKFTKFVYSLLDDYFGTISVKLTMKGVEIPNLLRGHFGFSLFAYQVEVDKQMPRILKEYNTIVSFINLVLQL